MPELRLLPHQHDLFTDTESAVLSCPSGVGAGKTRGLGYWAWRWCCDNPGVPLMLLEPTFPMVRDVLVPTLFEVFDELGCSYTYVKADQNIFLDVPGGTNEIRLRSGEHPIRVTAGQNLGAVGVDEAGQHKEELLRKVPMRVRNAAARYRQIVLTGTPEGFNTFHELTETKPLPGTRVIRARTQSNHHLPPDYVETYLGHLTDNERRQYLDGRFIPLGGTVYQHFDRDRNLGPCAEPLRGALYMLCDFNVGHMHWACARSFRPGKRAAFDGLHVWGEIVGQNTTTQQQAEEAVSFWRSRGVDPADVTVICDAAGAARSTSMGATGTDVQILRAAGFEVVHKRSNPPIKDRVNTVNQWLAQGALLFDEAGAPRTWRSIEQQGRDDNGMPSKSDGHDHACDAVGYGCWMLYPLRAPAGNLGTYR